jgi:hypothetical protein
VVRSRSCFSGFPLARKADDFGAQG